MRELNKKQKELLRKWHAEKEPTKEGKMLFGMTNPLFKWKHLTLEQMEELERINDFETITQTVDSFLWDLKINTES